MRLLTLALLFVAGNAWAQETTDVEAVQAHVHQLFDAMYASDADAVRAHFHPDATLYSVVRSQAGEVVVRQEDVQRFADIVGEAPAGALFERLGPIEVRIDGDLATAYMPYAFVHNGRFSHCGVNAFHLVRSHEGWRTIHITDTRRRTDCDPSVVPE